MKIIFTEEGWEDYLWFQETDKKLLKRLNALIKEIHRTYSNIMEIEGDLHTPSSLNLSLGLRAFDDRYRAADLALFYGSGFYLKLCRQR